MLNVYKVMSENITAAITHNGEQVRLIEDGLDKMFGQKSVLTKFCLFRTSFWQFLNDMGDSGDEAAFDQVNASGEEGDAEADRQLGRAVK